MGLPAVGLVGAWELCVILARLAGRPWWPPAGAAEMQRAVFMITLFSS